MSWCKNKFWVENPPELFCKFQIIPENSMSIEEQMNAFSRFILLLLLLLLIYTRIGFISLFISLFLSLLFIIILYYIQKKTMYNYKVDQIGTSNQSTVEHYIPTETSSHTRFCNDSRKIGANDPNYVSANQRLAGPPNPKTLIQPVVVPPITDLDYWRANNLINHSHINTESQTDIYLSGYQVSNYCNNTDIINDVKTPLGQFGSKTPSAVGQSVGNQGDCLERYSAVRESRGNSEGYEGYSCKIRNDDTDHIPPMHLQHVKSLTPTANGVFDPNCPTADGVFDPNGFNLNFELPYVKESPPTPLKVRDNEPGWVNTMCGYNPNQVSQSNLPSNLSSGNCDRSESMKQYNKNLFTQIIQPNVYTRNEIIEPINSNIGISFTQQFEPTTFSETDGNGLTYIEHDPRIYQPKLVKEQIHTSVNESNIYDPRFYGYGTSYRAYNDKNIGQTRFYYDDVNSIRMPNYISRSNIDFAKYADSYGPLHDNNKNGNPHTRDIRALAQETFLNSSLQQRNDLQERLMRKRNNELHQLRKYPMRTFGGKKGC